jgi:hypothetical protein
MSAQQLLMTAVSLQREGKSQADIEAALAETARREEPDSHARRNFAGQLELIFPDGQCLRFDGGLWLLHQQQQVAPLYEAVLAPFATQANGAGQAGSGAYGTGGH